MPPTLLDDALPRRARLRAAALMREMRLFALLAARWSDLPAGQRAALKAKATKDLDEAIAELADVRAAVADL